MSCAAAGLEEIAFEHEPVGDVLFGERIAQAVGDFRLIGGRTPAKQPTTVRLLYDHAALCLAFDCRDDAAAKIVKHVTTRDDSNIFGDDEVELFLAVFPDAEGKCWQLALNPANTQWDGIDENAGPSLAWTSATRVTEQGWTAESAIPFAALGLSEAPVGRTWRANLARSAKPAKENSTWNAVYRGFREPYSLGEWIFAPAP